MELPLKYAISRQAVVCLSALLKLIKNDWCSSALELVLPSLPGVLEMCRESGGQAILELLPSEEAQKQRAVTPDFCNVLRQLHRHPFLLSK